MKDEQSVRLNKYIANKGVCNRRQAEVLITKGKVTVNKKVVTSPAFKVNENDEVLLEGRQLKSTNLVYILFNKPKGVSTEIANEYYFYTKKICKEDVEPCDNLGSENSGLVLFTNDDVLITKLNSNKPNKRNILHLTLDKDVAEDDLIKLREGVELNDNKIFKALDISYTNSENKTQIGIECTESDIDILALAFDAMNYRLKKFDRVYCYGLTKKGLSRGYCRLLKPQEIAMLKMGSYK